MFVFVLLLLSAGKAQLLEKARHLQRQQRQNVHRQSRLLNRPAQAGGLIDYMVWGSKQSAQYIKWSCSVAVSRNAFVMALNIFCCEYKFACCWQNS